MNDKVIFEQRLERNKEWCHVDLWKRKYPGLDRKVNAKDLRHGAFSIYKKSKNPVRARDRKVILH
jgi:hypothetical protein